MTRRQKAAAIPLAIALAIVAIVSLSSTGKDEAARADSFSSNLGMALLVVLGVVLYFLPAFTGRNKRSAGAIFLLNLFLGWTLVGWVVALVWAANADPQEIIVASLPPQRPPILCPHCARYSMPGFEFCPACGKAFHT
jgi:hypothetical protein